MWKLSEIKIKNIVSFREASLVVEQGVATLIFGKNEDNASQPCNGSGKSSLIEAISFALTGEQMRKVKSVDEIINDHEESAYVYLKLMNDYNNTTFTIERTISRNSPQNIECHKYDESGKEIETDKTIQPTVLDYNKFILSEIGLTKDDIYSNYILCDNKYESFFDCSDKNKKEIINRFSNGIIVDESIERVQKDMEPVKIELTDANNQVINIKGSISAIESELEAADEKKASAEQDRVTKIKQMDENIQKCRNDIDIAESNKISAKARLELLNKLSIEVSEMDESDITLFDAYNKIKNMCTENNLGKVSEYDVLFKQYNDSLSKKQQDIDSIGHLISESEKLIDGFSKSYNEQQEKYTKLCQDEESITASENIIKNKIQKELDNIDDRLDEIEANIKSSKKKRTELDMAIHRNKTLLNGAVTCPSCNHKFFINNEKTVSDIDNEIKSLTDSLKNNDKRIDELTKEFEHVDNEGANKEKELDKINSDAKERSVLLNKEYDAMKNLSNVLDNESQKLANNKIKLTSCQNELDVINGKIDVLRNKLFGEITGIIEGRIMNGQNFIKQQDDSLSFINGQMKQYQLSKKELLEAPEMDFTSTLKKSLRKYKSALKEAENALYSVQEQYDKLKEQEVNFTMFKSYIAKKKIDALSLIVNDFLEKIGSDIRLKLEGFTVTKTGKLRDKISVQVMRDGIDCGSYHKFSGGEKARLNLACILSLHTLTNSNCEDGKGLDFIIIDELLDKSDEMGMATYCNALNKLNQTALLITQGNVSEGYPHKLLIVKKQGISSIQN